MAASPSNPFRGNRLVRVYACIDAHFASRGRPSGKNVLWVAATATLFGARRPTAGRDFDPLDPLFISRDRIEPAGARPDE